MAETLGMLCDKLTIVKLKQFHTEDENQLKSLEQQEKQLKDEIDGFVVDAVGGNIPAEKLTFASNKIYKKEGNKARSAGATIAAAFAQLADVNCRLWHEVEKGYDIENVPVSEKDKLIKSLAVLNLERNNCIDAIDVYFKQLLTAKTNL
jgi:hypothetical protein